MYFALAVTSTTYVLISLGVFGTLTVTEVVGYGETAIAEAARPSLGEAGFLMMAIAAPRHVLVGERNALCLRRAYRHARRGGPVPAILRPRFAARTSRGLLITSALVLAVANLVDLSAIALGRRACSS